MAGLSDANGSFTRSGFDTFFEDRELFKHVEIGWVPSFERRYDDIVEIEKNNTLRMGLSWSSHVNNLDPSLPLPSLGSARRE